MNEHQRELLAKLSKSPEWEALTAYSKDLMEMHFKQLAVGLMTKDKEVEYGDLQYRRGLFAGMKLLLDGPVISAAQIERELQKGTVS